MNEFIYGTVSNNTDPDSMGRIKVSYSLQGEDTETDWLPILSFYATNGSGAFFLPEVGDQVVIAFQDARHQAGFVLGSLHHQDNLPPSTEENTDSDLNADGENNLQFIKSRSGNKLILDDKSGEEKIQLIAADGATRFEFLMADEMINLETDKDLRISAAGKIMIEAEEAELSLSGGLQATADGISIESDSDVSLTASDNMNVEGSSVKLN
ncbi:phage baseplate assembly protein V [Spirochaeta cellobiosiphila]|uniref:phage baseplate assembly protein V n=1 Tax=Spirochaeta cellobiosiphila TaxID=504483 RepID=UPI0004126DAD|nr:phage baseplate assembly protein V [Spirochaeta cellobiosiphila]